MLDAQIDAKTSVRVSRASRLDTLRVMLVPFAATVATGVIVRRPWAVRLAARVNADRHGVRQLQRMRERYGPGLLRLRVPFRPMAVALSDDAVREALTGTPVPYTAANREKVAALSRFQPGGVLISPPEARPERRLLNTEVLNTDRPVHSSADVMGRAIDEEARGIADAAAAAGLLTWDAFAAGWWRMVRRVVLGDSAREDAATTNLLERLRKDANWGPFHPGRPAVRTEFLRRVREYVDKAEPGSLAELAAHMAVQEPEHQVPQWLFAFDAAGIGVYRVLALLATHPDAAAKAEELPYLRACLQEAIRLWPTTPAILRDYTGPPAKLTTGEMVAIYAPYFHRDERRLPYAHRFTPEIWLDGRAEQSWALVPFSAGPAQCPGRNLVLYTTSTMLAGLRARHQFQFLAGQRLDPGRNLPGSIDHVSMRFRVTRR